MSFQDLLGDKLPEKKLALVPRGFEIIGDIAIINLAQTLEKEKHIIAEALLSHRKDIKTVLRKITKLEGEKRTGNFEMLLGSNTTTMHRENGCIFHIDVTRAYFSGKLAYERRRISDLVKDGENILVLFCGVGPFLIPIAKKRKVDMIGLDSNPDACALLKKNAAKNRIDANIVLGDARTVNNLFRKLFDRIVMPAPYCQDHFLNIAGPLLEPEGIIHFYTFKKDFELSHFKRLLMERGYRIEFFRKCGSVAPRVNRYVFDLRKL